MAAAAAVTGGAGGAGGEAVPAALRQAAARIGEWIPKGVHFGWERSFRNKGKFLATMSKEEARTLVGAVLSRGAIEHRPNRRGGALVADQWVVVAEAGQPIGTRGQNRVRIVLVRDERGYRVDNAFPVRLR